jgi:putative transposase
MLLPDLRLRLYQYFGGIIRNLNGVPEEINGTEDHVHIVVSLPGVQAPAMAVRDLKANSSRWIHQTFPTMAAFGWQNEHAGFSVSPRLMEEVCRYVRKQEEHHAKVSFIDELKWLLKGHGIDFDEQYL